MGTTQEAGRKTPDLGLLPEEVGLSEAPEDLKGDSQAGTPSTLALCGQRPMRKRLSAPELQLNLTQEPGGSAASPGHSAPSSPDGSSDLELEGLETPSDSEQLDSGHEFEWEDELPRAEGLAASEAAERLGRGCVWDVAGEDGHHWRVFRTGQREQRVDMTAIEPYKKVLSHGGYHGDGLNAVILFASCYLPRGSIPNYAYVMEHLFRYMVGTLELLVAENYLLVHLSGGTSRAQVPPLGWIRQCYRTLDRRLRKNLRALVVVHATWYVKAFLALLRPFIRYQLWDKGSLPFAPFSSKDGEVPSSHGRSVFWTVWESWPNLSPWIKSTSLKLSDSSTGISTAQQVPSTGLGKALRTKQRWRSALPGS
nr:bcl-2/adenovirus E1B 19 kDa-interacting protein 2-like protein isoform X2 [Oryctolagus cuniculus]